MSWEARGHASQPSRVCDEHTPVARRSRLRGSSWVFADFGIFGTLDVDAHHLSHLPLRPRMRAALLHHFQYPSVGEAAEAEN